MSNDTPNVCLNVNSMCAAVICAKDIMSSVLTTAAVVTSKEKQDSGDHDNNSKPGGVV